MSIVGWIKKQGDFVMSLGVLIGGASAVIMFFGGSIPPWYTPVQAKADEAVVTKLQQLTIDTLSKLNDKIDRTSRRMDQIDCRNLNIALARAKAALEKSPSDTIAQTLRDTTIDQMRAIDNCAPY